METVLNGQKALKKFESGRYDVALIDLGMPRKSGDQVAQQMRQADPSVATVLMTGWNLSENDPRMSVFDFKIPKPFADLDNAKERWPRCGD